jgi:hypothetical protein
MLSVLIAKASNDTLCVKTNALAKWFVLKQPQLMANKLFEMPLHIKDITNKEWTGYITFEITDSTGKQVVDGSFSNVFPNQYFSVAANDTATLQFPFSPAADYSGNIIITLKMYTDKLIDTMQFKLKVHAITHQQNAMIFSRNKMIDHV